MAETGTEDIDVEVKEITEIRQLSPGDQIAVNGEMKGVKYFHHGIYSTAHEYPDTHRVKNTVENGLCCTVHTV